MNITDTDLKPGTAEHCAWVRHVFIPNEGLFRFETDRQRAGAPSIGKELIHGSHQIFVAYTAEFERAKRALQQLMNTLYDIDFEVWRRKLQSFGSRSRHNHPNSRRLARSRDHRR